MINLTRLRHVIAVDRTGSVSGGAVAVHVTQSAVTKSVAAVEEELGYALFERRARGVSATVEGREFIDHASRIVADMDLLILDARHHRKRQETLLRIGICPPAFEPLLAGPIGRLVQGHPQLCLQMAATSSERALRMLKRGDIDILVGPTDLFRGIDEIAHQEVGLLRAHLFTRVGHPLLAESELRVEQLSGFPIISPELVPGYENTIRELYARHNGDPLRMISIIDQFSIVRAAVRSSDRIGIVGGTYVTGRAFTEDFRILDIDFFEPVTFSCASLHRSQPTAIAKRFVSLLGAAFLE